MKTDGSNAGEKGRSLERTPALGLKEMLNSDYVKNRFAEVLKDRAPAFLASVLSATLKNPELAKCDQHSILSSAMVAATLDLPIDSNLGFAALVPYKTKVRGSGGKEYWATVAQFQIMYRGYVQLALRSNQYKAINVSPIYEDELESFDIISGDIFLRPVSGGYREQENTDKIVGYVAFFRLLNGYERTDYWPISRIRAHGERFSKSFKNPHGLWQKDPHAMYAKTVLKNTLSKWGILSVTMQTAVVADQAVIRDFGKPIDRENVSYVDTADPSHDGIEAGETHEIANGADTESVNVASSVKPEEAETVPAGRAGAGEAAARSAEANGGGQARQKPAAEGAAGGKPEAAGDGLFSSDEESDFEAQYERHTAMNLPDFD